jgi:aldose 1-epimerase
MSKMIRAVPLLALLGAVACGGGAAREGSEMSGDSGSHVTVSRARFGTMPDGMPVDVFTLRNGHGMEVRAITYGGIIISLRVPDRSGTVGDVVLGYDSLSGYLKDSPYFGAIVGRYGNRIAKGRFTLDGVTYRLATNNGPNHLHGGLRGFDKVVWSAQAVSNDSGAGVRLTYESPDGDQGYPGTLRAEVRYLLTDRDELVVDYHATTDKATPVNLTQHSYFNLAGAGTRDVLDHVLWVNADRYTPVDSTLIPTGALAPVQGTPFDFRTATAIGTRIGANDQQIRFGGGYDHNFVLNRSDSGLTHAARVVEPTTGRTLDVYTDQPGLQFYSGNFLDGSIMGKGGHVYGHRFGFCLETQHFPDSPNEAAFPSTILRPGEEYRTRTVFAFGVEK